MTRPLNELLLNICLAYRIEVFMLLFTFGSHDIKSVTFNHTRPSCEELTLTAHSYRVWFWGTDSTDSSLNRTGRRWGLQTRSWCTTYLDERSTRPTAGPLNHAPGSGLMPHICKKAVLLCQFLIDHQIVLVSDKIFKAIQLMTRYAWTCKKCLCPQRKVLYVLFYKLYHRNSRISQPLNQLGSPFI